MIKCKLILPVVVTVAMAGCVTTEQMPDGTTKIRFSDETVSSLTSMMPNGVVNGLAGGAAGGELDLIPVLNPLGNGQYLYLGGRYEYKCAAAMLYSAKSGKPLDAKVSDDCQQYYLIRQDDLKSAGKPYDRAAPAYDAVNPPRAYWQSLTARTISQLAAQNQFTTRFTGMPRFDNGRNLYITVGFLGEAKGQDYALVTTPARTPVVINDGDFEAKMRSKAAALNTRVGDMTLCDAVLIPKGAVDKGRKPANISSADYAQHEVRFTVASLSCKNSAYKFTNAAR
ncbi:hypothetical protein [Pseudomonas sp. S36]|uniref:hypothetical protein n=1 Tax=Pseudomonas sp. S36 TaxID=2767447 RepID=UPI00191208BF|nr:hypothetical protein [Pseudomonas sp. S36]MBK4987441.1 hypothetical protein [Pseudomonas sp. S36]